MVRYYIRETRRGYPRLKATKRRGLWWVKQRHLDEFEARWSVRRGA